MKKLSKKEENEFVTKGFLVRYLDDVLDKKLEEKLEEKLEQKFNEKFALWSDQMARHVASLIEDSNSKFEIFYEGFEGHDVRIRRLERQVKYMNL